MGKRRKWVPSSSERELETKRPDSLLVFQNRCASQSLKDSNYIRVWWAVRDILLKARALRVDMGTEASSQAIVGNGWFPPPQGL